MSNFKKPSKRTREPEPEIEKPPEPVTKCTIDLGNPDIIKGIPGCGMGCPLALAGNRCIPGVYHVKITHDALYAFFGTKKGTKKFPFPEKVAGYVEEYDRTGKMVPFSWEIDLCSLQSS